MRTEEEGEDVMKEMMRQLLEGMAALHESNVTHRSGYILKNSSDSSAAADFLLAPFLLCCFDCSLANHLIISFSS